MPTVKLDETLEMYYEDDDFTDPWRTPETVVLHHGTPKAPGSGTPGCRCWPGNTG